MFAPARLLTRHPLSGDSRSVVGKGDAALVGSPTFDANEKRSGKPTLRLDGASQYVMLPATDLGEEFTVTLWAKLEDLGADQVLFGNAGEKSPGFCVAIIKEGKILVHDSDGKRGHEGASYAGVFPFGRWNNIALGMARYRQAVRVFVNGLDVTRDDHVGSNAFPITLPLAVGAGGDGGGFVRGHVADLRIYTGRVRPREIAVLAAGSDAGVGPGNVRPNNSPSR